MADVNDDCVVDCFDVEIMAPVDVRLHKSKIASPSWAVRQTGNDVEDVSVFYEGNAISSRCGFLAVVENNPERSGFWRVAKT